MRLGALIAVLAVLLPAAALASSTGRARVALISASPVSVHGSGFKARERVVVTVLAKSSRTKAVRATRRGAFTVRFPALSIAYCDGYAIRAKGSRGSTAFIQVTPDCAPQGPAEQPDVLMPVDPIPKH